MFIDLKEYSDKRICVALSGGSDSIALCHYLYSNKDKYSFSLSAVNCEHGIRGEDSLKDTLFVKKFCEKYSIPLFCFSEDCPKKAREEKMSLETAARCFRYASFEKIINDGKADFIATAHHALDNAETVLFNLCRGSSLSGLKGICDRQYFIRPLINTTKEEILEYINENSLSFVEDKTNYDTEITRNALRLKVIPKLEKYIPGATKNISKFTSLAREDDDFLYSLSKQYITRFENSIKISFCPPSLFRRALLTAIKQLGIEKDYTSEHLNSVYDLLNKENSAEISLPKNIIAVKESDGVVLYKKRQKTNEETPFKLGITDIGEARIYIGKEQSPSSLKFDLKKLPKNCVIRFRQDGDVFVKFGGKKKKLKEFFNEKKIPKRDRDFIPLIAKRNEIFCVCGKEISEKIKTTNASDVYYINLLTY